MGLDLASLKTALETAFGVNQVSDSGVQASIRSMADSVATAIDTYVKSGTVNVTSNGTDSDGDTITNLPGTGSVT